MTTEPFVFWAGIIVLALFIGLGNMFIMGYYWHRFLTLTWAVKHFLAGNEIEARELLKMSCKHGEEHYIQCDECLKIYQGRLNWEANKPGKSWDTSQYRK